MSTVRVVPLREALERTGETISAGETVPGKVHLKSLTAEDDSGSTSPKASTSFFWVRHIRVLLAVFFCTAALVVLYVVLDATPTTTQGKTLNLFLQHYTQKIPSAVEENCPSSQFETELPTGAKKCAPLTICSTGEYQSKPPAAKLAHDGSTVLGYVSNRGCTALTLCTSATQFESISATASSDRACGELTTCVGGQFESTAATTTSNRECSPHTLCDFSSAFQMAEGTATTDTKCNPLTICTPQEQYQTKAPAETTDRACADLVACTADEYQAGIDANGNRKCKTLTTCGTTQYESVAATALSDRGCEDEIVCGNTQSKSGTGEDAVCVVGRLETRRQRRQLADQYWNKCETGQYISSGRKPTKGKKKTFYNLRKYFTKTKCN
jgi:hypothetical protein